MTLFTVMEKVCKSSKDIMMMNHLTEMVDNKNVIRIENISSLAKDMELSRAKLTSFLKLLVDNNFTNKLDRGVYMVNPYIFIGRRVRSNELRESAQRQWTFRSKPQDSVDTGSSSNTRQVSIKKRKIDE